MWIVVARCYLCMEWIEQDALWLHALLVHPGEPREADPETVRGAP